MGVKETAKEQRAKINEQLRAEADKLKEQLDNNSNIKKRLIRNLKKKLRRGGYISEEKKVIDEQDLKILENWNDLGNIRGDDEIQEDICKLGEDNFKKEWCVQTLESEETQRGLDYAQENIEGLVENIQDKLNKAKFWKKN